MHTIHRYTATHAFTFTLDEGVVCRNGRGAAAHEIDQIKVVIDWYEKTAEGDPAGWNVDIRLLGWPLTAKGARDKRAKTREWPVSYYKYPAALRKPVLEAYTTAVATSGIDPDLILDRPYLLGPKEYLTD